MRRLSIQIGTLLFVLLTSFQVWASEEVCSTLGYTEHPLGVTCLVLFVIAYIFVMSEEFSHLRKSKPVVLGAAIIWALVAIMGQQKCVPVEQLHASLDHNIKEYCELLLFLLVAMTYINSMTERNVFEALRSWLVIKGFGLRKLFWITGILAFFISPIADNLTTALLMGAVVMAVGSDKPRFVSLAFINIVVAANAGGAFSPFGDITTLMVWQAGKEDFFGFFHLFIPAVVNYIVPAAIMHFAVPKQLPTSEEGETQVPMKRGARRICLLFLLTITTAVTFKQFLHLPPFMGMMAGLSYLFIFSYYLKKTGHDEFEGYYFNIFNKISRAEWDTLLFFFGVIFCVGGLGYIGYLEFASHFTYGELGATWANISAGVLSAIVDNIPVMYAVITMDPPMDAFQWLLVTLTAGVGGSMLSIGSAAGVALMGQSKGMYTFFSHLRWAPVIVLGYAASIAVHFLVNASMIGHFAAMAGGH
jgi:NhaD family Na+/H+ antiporter